PSHSDRLAVTVAAFLFGQGDGLVIAAIRESIARNYRVAPDRWLVQSSLSREWWRVKTLCRLQTCLERRQLTRPLSRVADTDLEESGTRVAQAQHRSVVHRL